MGVRERRIFESHDCVNTKATIDATYNGEQAHEAIDRKDAKECVDAENAHYGIERKRRENSIQRVVGIESVGRGCGFVSVKPPTLVTVPPVFAREQGIRFSTAFFGADFGGDLGFIFSFLDVSHGEMICEIIHITGRVTVVTYVACFSRVHEGATALFQYLFGLMQLGIFASGSRYCTF